MIGERSSDLHNLSRYPSGRSGREVLIVNKVSSHCKGMKSRDLASAGTVEFGLSERYQGVIDPG